MLTHWITKQVKRNDLNREQVRAFVLETMNERHPGINWYDLIYPAPRAKPQRVKPRPDFSYYYEQAKEHRERLEKETNLLEALVNKMRPDEPLFLRNKTRLTRLKQELHNALQHEATRLEAKNKADAEYEAYYWAKHPEQKPR